MLHPVKTRTSLSGKIPRALHVSAQLSWKDKAAAAAIRAGIGRTKASIKSGLYYTGRPEKNSPVLVTSNYRLTFDAVRKELGGLDVWILVIDTGGVNVWCSAGKGSFSASSVIKEIKSSQLSFFAPDGMLILPQLSASGVNINKLRRETKYKAVFGPVYARDLKEFIESGMKKDRKMKRVTFTLKERAVLIPVELVHAWKIIAAFILLSFMTALPFDGSFLHRYFLMLFFLEISVVNGTVLTPLLLPYIPGRFFSVKGLFVNLLWTALFFVCNISFVYNAALSCISVILLGTAAASFTAMNFTGCSTFTSQKGTELEVKRSFPLQIIASAAGLITAVIHAISVLTV